MIESIEFTNFKALRKTTLPLAPFTLLLGPNGSGKSSVLQALEGVAALYPQPEGSQRQGAIDWIPHLSVATKSRSTLLEIKLNMRFNERLIVVTLKWSPFGQINRQLNYEDGTALKQDDEMIPLQWLGRMQTYVLDASAIAAAVLVGPRPTLQPNGAGLAAVLDNLRDNDSERWKSLLAEMCDWLPEYDDMGFDKPEPGVKSIKLRTRKGKHQISARDLSQGTLIALALLTLAYLPDPPSLIGLEEIDRGLHPRLLRRLQDALYRLSYPESCGETRPPIQVIATTHSPYLLDLYREHPEEIVLARKEGLEVEMKRLTDIEHYQEILGESPLSEVWYSGVLGGASVKP